MKIKLIKNLLLSVIVFSLCSSGFAWGPTGHRAVGEIASKHLTKRAKKAVRKILEGRTLADVTTWADEIRSDHKYNSMSPYHYTNIPDGHEKYDPDLTGMEVDIVRGIYMMIDIIEGRKKHDLMKTKKEALMFLTHLIGDLHQPLHVGGRLLPGTENHDRGGNDVKVAWMCTPSNLHRVWDEDMIDLSKFTYTELEKVLNRKEFIKKSWYGKTVEDWANESIALRDQVYTLEDPTYNAVYDRCPELKLPKLGYYYSYKNWDAVRLRVLQGGIRLAETLNKIFSKKGYGRKPAKK